MTRDALPIFACALIWAGVAFLVLSLSVTSQSLPLAVVSVCLLLLAVATIAAYCLTPPRTRTIGLAPPA